MGEERNFPGLEWGGGGDWSFPGKEAGPREGARSGRAGHVDRKGNPFLSWPLPGLGPGFRHNSAALSLHRGDHLGAGCRGSCRAPVDIGAHCYSLRLSFRFALMILAQLWLWL